MGRFLDRHGRASKVSAMVAGVERESIDLDRSRKVSFRKTARKPASMLVTDKLTVKVTVKVCGAAVSPMQINSLQGSLMIEWE